MASDRDRCGTRVTVSRPRLRSASPFGWGVPLAKRDAGRVRVVVLGRGGAGKTTAAARISRLSDAPMIELDKHFWSADLTPLSRSAWLDVQRDLAASDEWIMDGDLGRYDVLAPRLARADTVVVFDFSLARCVWNAVRRSRERPEFWWWVLTWRAVHRPRILREIRQLAPHARLAVLRRPRDVAAFIAEIT